MSWIPYDYENKDANPLPKQGELVWIHDEFYDGVTLGSWWGIRSGWWENYRGVDDVGVSHWMPLERPEAPNE